MNIEEITVTNVFGTEVHIVITNEDSSQVSMLKSTYDALLEEQANDQSL